MKQGNLTLRKCQCTDEEVATAFRHSAICQAYYDDIGHFVEPSRTKYISYINSVWFPGGYCVPFLEILPQSEESLLARWKSPGTSAISEYVLEWKPLSGTNLNHVSFEIVGKNQTSFVISGTLKNKPITLPFSQDLSECLLTINAQINCIFVSILGLKPYMPYEISVYPKYGGVIGHPNSTMIYTKEKGKFSTENCNWWEKHYEKNITHCLWYNTSL